MGATLFTSDTVLDSDPICVPPPEIAAFAPPTSILQ